MEKFLGNEEVGGGEVPGRNGPSPILASIPLERAPMQPLLMEAAQRIGGRLHIDLYVDGDGGGYAEATYRRHYTCCDVESDERYIDAPTLHELCAEIIAHEDAMDAAEIEGGHPCAIAKAEGKNA